jgi:uncharacterized protein YbjT (DUF2867 family)
VRLKFNKETKGKMHVAKPLILVTGATGTVGSEVVKQLAEAGEHVRVLTRDPEKAKKFDKPVEVVRGDLSQPDSLETAFSGVEKALVISNIPDIAGLEMNAFKAAKSARVKHIVKLSGIPVYMDLAKDAYLAKAHWESEDFLRGLGISWTVLRPSYFMSNMLFWGVLERGVLELPSGAGKDAPIDPRDISAVAVKVLTSTGHEGKVYEITGPELLSQNDMLQEVAAFIGKPLKFVDVSPEVWREQAVGGGFPPALADAMLKHCSLVKSGELAFVRPTVQQLLGRPAYTFKDWLASSPFAGQ